MIRGRVATKVIDAVTNHYGFHVGKDPADIEHNKNKRLDLLRDNAFVYKVLFLCSFSLRLIDHVQDLNPSVPVNYFRNSIISTTLSIVLFGQGDESFGLCYVERFKIIPLELLALLWTLVNLFLYISPHNAHMHLDSLRY